MENAEDGDCLVFDFIDDDIRHARDDKLAAAFQVAGAAMGRKLDQSLDTGTDGAADFLRAPGTVFCDELEKRNKVIMGKAGIAELHAPYLA